MAESEVRDPSGKAIPPNDPRLPSPSDTDGLRRRASLLDATIEGLLGHPVPRQLVLEARVDALVSLFVPPDQASPVRRLYEHRAAANEVRSLETLLAKAQEKAEADRAAEVRSRLVLPS